MTVGKNLQMLVPDNTLYFNATVDGDGNINSIEKIPIGETEDLISLGSNLILSTILSKAYGIDIAGIVKDFADADTDPRIVGLSPVFKNCDWDNATIIDNSVTPATSTPVLKYIKKKFRIYSSDSFIDELYVKLNNAVVGMQYDYINEYTLVHIDGETNLMINVLAVVIGSNNSFMDIPVGGEHYINIPLDPEHIDLFFEEIRKILVDGGYLASSISSLSLDSGIDEIFNPNTTNGFNVDGDFKYGHLFIAKCNDNDRWRPYVMATRFLVKEPITFNTQYETRGDYNYLFAPVFINQEDDLSYNRQYILVTPARVQYRIYMFPMGTTNQIFASLDNCMGADDERNIYKHCTYENSSLGDRTWLLVGTHSQSYTGPYNEVNTPTLQPIVNNRADGGTTSIHNPDIDSITEQNLEDNNIGLVCTGNEELDIYFTFDTVSSALYPSDMPFDTSGDLKIGTVDPMLNVLINDPNTTVTAFEETNRADWTPLWIKGVTLKYNSHMPVKLGGGLPYYLTPHLLSYVLTDLWDKSLWHMMIELKLCFEDRFESVLFLRQLPYTFIKNVDYLDGPDESTKEDDIFFNSDGTIPIMYGSVRPQKGIDYEGQTYYGKSSGYYICSPVHEITFTLKGDDIVRLHGDFTDYTPYVKTSIYLPFIGYREIQPEYIMKEELIVKYRISNITGDFVATVISMNEYQTDKNTNGKRPPSQETYIEGGPILMETGNMAINGVLSGKNADVAGVIGGVTNAISSMAGVPMTDSKHRSGVIAGGLMGAVGGVASAGMSLLAGGPVNHTGANGNDVQWLMWRKPHILMTYNPPIIDCKSVDTAFSKQLGFASSRSVHIKNMGPHYHELASVKLDGINCLEEERNMIRDILMGGFYNGLAKGETLVTPD